MEQKLYTNADSDPQPPRSALPLGSSKNLGGSWPKDLLRIFEDPLFANVHPRAPKPTEEDVVRNGFRMLCQWSREHERRAPKMDKRNREEWLLARRLQGIIEDDVRREMLRAEDEYKLLDTVYDE